jgi:FHA domain-containing protein
MSLTRTVVPGDWYGVLGASVIVLLPPSAKARVAGLWETVDDGAGFDEVLDALISGGLRELPSFVLVSGEGRDVKVVIRGSATAELHTPDGPVTVSGSADTTWVEQNVTGVSGLRVQVADGDGAAYTIDTGLVRVASVEHPSGGGAGPTRVPDAEAGAVPVAPTLTPPIEPDRPRRILPPDPLLEKPEQVETPTVVTAPPVAPVPGAPVPVPDALGGSSFDPLTSPELAVSPGDAADPPESAAVARLIFSSGEVVDVDRVVVVGRAPDVRRIDGDEPTRLVTVPSPHQEISSTHLEIRPGVGADQGSAVVSDLGSTNGTVVVQPGLPAEDLRPGIGVQLVPGSTIDLGEGVTIQVARV